MILRLLFIVLLLLTLSCKNGIRKNNDKLPNVVFIVVDTLRADHLPFYGYRENTAPFLSSLAGKSSLFLNVFSASSWTAPATASIFTSLYPFQHRVVMNMLATLNFNSKKPDIKIKLNSIPDEIETLGEVFRNRGYTTFGFADNINIGKKEGFDQGFDLMRTFNYRNGENLNKEILKNYKKIKSSRRYFLYIHYMDPHQPNHFYKEWLTGRKMADVKKTDSKKQRLSKRLINESLKYDGEINYVDGLIRKLYSKFGWDKNTIIVFTADHGEELYDHGKWGHGYSLYNEVVKVPLLIYDSSGKFKRVKIEDNVSTLDILPTLKEIIGAAEGKYDEGVSLLSYLKKEKSENVIKRILFSHLSVKRVRNKINFTQEAFAVIDGTKIFLSESNFPFNEHSNRLFDMGEDPHQKKNIYKKNISLANRMKKSFFEFFRKSKKFKKSSKLYRTNKRELDRLKTLGYIQEK